MYAAASKTISCELPPASADQARAMSYNTRYSTDLFTEARNLLEEKRLHFSHGRPGENVLKADARVHIWANDGPESSGFCFVAVKLKAATSGDLGK